MTTIVGIVKDGKGYMGADSQSSSGWMKCLTVTPKIWKDGKCLIGFAGGVREQDLVMSMRKQSIVPDQNGIGKYVASLRAYLRECGALKVESGIEQWNGVLLIVTADSILEIDERFGVLQPKTDFWACGSGRELALGAMHMTQELIPITVDRITHALSAAAAFDNGTGGEFTILSTE